MRKERENILAALGAGYPAFFSARRLYADLMRPFYLYGYGMETNERVLK